MAPKSKQRKSNGFMVFTLEWKSKYGSSVSISEATAEAGKVWARMSADERAPYNGKAKEERNVVFSSREEKLTCTGIPISQVEKERSVQDNKERLAKRDIEACVAKSVEKFQLETQSYYFIMANYFTKTMKGGVYVPAEIAVCKFSLKGGVQHMYQTLINPGVNIYGHQYEAQHHSETTHALPLPPNALGDSNLGSIYNDILNFIREQESNDYPPLYTHRDSIHVVESILEFLKSDIGANNIDLKVYPIQYLFYIMKEATCDAGELEKPKSIYITDAFFERDFFEFQSGIGCQFHEDKDRSNYCTQSYVTRWGFMFADYMCNDIAVPLVPGSHCPMNTNINAIVTPAPSNCNDSFISIGTTDTYGTKAVAGSKLYYDDQKTSISDASKTYTVEFPSLAGRVNSKKKSALQVTSSARQNVARVLEDSIEVQDDSEEYGDLNPWTSRSRNIPRPPGRSHFEINYNGDDLDSDADDYNSVASFGRGRILMANASLNGSLSSYGRGRCFRP